MKKLAILFISVLLIINAKAQNQIELANKNLVKAKALYEYINYDSAIALYKQASEIFKKDKKYNKLFECQIGIGQCYLKKNELAKALNYFKDLQSKAEKQFGENTAFPLSCLYYQGYANLYLKEMDKAEKQIKNVLDIQKKLFGENHADVAKSYNLLGQYFLFKGDYENTLLNFDKSLKIREKLFSPVHPDVAQSLHNISSIYYYKGFLDTAIYLANKSLAIKEQRLPKDHPDFIPSYHALGVFLTDKMEYKGALDMHMKNLLLCEKYYGEQNQITATLCQSIGICHYNFKDYKNAFLYFDRAIDILKSIKNSEKSEIASIYLSKGNVYDEVFDYNKAIKIKKEAVKIYENTMGKSHPNTALAYSSLAISLKNAGIFDESIQLFENALEIFRQNQGNVNPNSAMCLTNLAAVYTQLGQNEQSLKHYQQALSIYNEFYSDEKYETAILYNNLGELYNTMGEYGNAIKCLDKSLKISLDIFGEQSEAVAICYKNIGNTYEFSGNDDEALVNYKKALEICLKSLGDNNLTTASIYENIAKVLESKNDFEQAKIASEKALEIRRDLLPSKHYLTAYSFCDLAYIEYKLGNLNQALSYYELGLQANLWDYTPAGINYSKIPEINNYLDINLILTALKGKLLVFIDRFQIEKSNADRRDRELKSVLDHLKACDITIDIIRKSYIDEKDKLSFSANSIAVYDLALNFTYLMYLDTRDKTYLELAFYYSEKLKAQTLFEAMMGSEAKKFGNIPDSIINKEKTLNKQITGLRKQIAENRYSNLDDELFRLEKEKQNLIQLCESSFPKYYALKYANKIPDIKTIQATLDKNTALISYYQTNSHVFQLILSNKEINIKSTEKFDGFDQKLNDLRHSIIFGDLKSNIDKYNQLAYELYRLLFPESPEKNLKNLIIIPAGNLANIPFEALLTGKINEKQKFKDYPFLINDYNISYAYSANLYYLSSQKAKQNQIEITQLNDWLALAPVFSDETTSGISMRSRGLLNKINKSMDSLNTRGTLLNGNYVSPLPGTENEVKAIFNEFDSQNKKAELKIYQSANELFVKSDELKKYNFIHFATHGFVDSEEPELSGILLAQDTTGGNDGILFSGEIYNLELNANLVTLSACETGLGKIQSGEGIIGLTRALLYAGARNIIVSLWQVSDEATSKLMIDFYAEMLKSANKQTFSAYLQTAKLKMIKEGKFSHPFFWSPFILIGK